MTGITKPGTVKRAQVELVNGEKSGAAVSKWGRCCATRLGWQSLMLRFAGPRGRKCGMTELSCTVKTRQVSRCIGATTSFRPSHKVPRERSYHTIKKHSSVFH